MRSFSVDDTIAAIASSPNPAPRGILRISGQAAIASLQKCFANEDGSQISFDRRISSSLSCRLNLDDGRWLPGRILLWPTHRSYTRQPLAEFHTIGSPALLQIALKVVCQAGARLAGPGEFTLRAFLAGRLDLTQAEAVLGLIDADSSAEFSTALSQAAGGLADPFRTLRSDLLDVLADLEAALDFVDEDIEFISKNVLLATLNSARDLAASLQSRIECRSVSSKAIRVALVGNPNVGKSSLFNALLCNPAAIVSSTPGTTRDYLTAQIIFRGQPIELIDTAGLESIDWSLAGQHEHFVEEQAQSKTRQQLTTADFVIFCVDSSRPLDEPERILLANKKSNWIIVATKVDCSATELLQDWISTSSIDRTGLERLLDSVIERQLNNGNRERDVVAWTTTRCTESIHQIAAALTRAAEAAELSLGDELVAAEIRVALEHLGQIVGTVYNDDVLDRVFSRFCIGK